MTVRELIKQLEEIENKDLEVVMNGYEGEVVIADDVFETEEYYWGCDNGHWQANMRKCIKIIE